MSASNDISQAVQAGAAPWIERFARIGYTAKALLYATVGILAAEAALGQGGRTTDTRGALGTILGAPFGRAMLFTMALGLAGYALWRLVEALTDPEGRGTGAKALALRASYAARGVIYLGLALAAFRLAIGRHGSGGSDRTEDWTRRALEAPAGEWLVWIAAAVVAAYGLYQLYRAYAAKLGRQLNIGQVSRETGRWVLLVSRFGIAARGVVFCLIAVFLTRAGAQHDAHEAGGVRESLEALGRLGRWPLGIMALGLVAYGAYELLNARYRRIRVE